MVFNSHQPFTNFEDSGFLDSEFDSDPADSDYSEVNLGEIAQDINHFSDIVATVPLHSEPEDNQKAAERQRRIMSRIPQ
ncbi:hypothetical protein NIES2119_19205 [[Phormidium ambiguum] IAM M-71]|uniref:Uncharacterized protein n=1 Tax=[Phormidium ambiguum] IAM M-71 TaxID=454136 RepID=A0A1U7IFU1_9CYAN|nr:hypothetical protein [Phormidium ambiguum]OKH35868.1 hypothetical protein NIES2119_19205 [Phormidium ambiguum IAM M-71]